MNDARFRSFFGFPGSPFGSSGFGRYEEDSDELDDPHDVFDRFRFGSFGRSTPFNDMNDVFKGAETMLRHMDSMFRDMHTFGGSGDSFARVIGPAEPDSFDPHLQVRKNPRDEMLKVPDSQPGLFESNEKVETLYPGVSDNRVGIRRPFSGWSELQGHSSVTIVGVGDRKVEQRRTTKYSDGSTSTTITKRLGNREMNIITKVNANGETEIEENLVNMGEDEKTAFEAEWNSSFNVPAVRDNNSNCSCAVKDTEQTKLQTPVLDPKGPSIFKRLFGSWR